jgi:hypothetical protein
MRAAAQFGKWFATSEKFDSRDGKELEKSNCGAELQFEKICKKLSRHKVSEHALAR